MVLGPEYLDRIKEDVSEKSQREARGIPQKACLVIFNDPCRARCLHCGGRHLWFYFV